MVTFALELARRFEGVPFAPGMRLGSGAIVVAVEHERVLLVSMTTGALMPMGWVASKGMALDYTDPGTLGHILAAVRAAYRLPHLSLGMPACTDDVHALAAAWEGRPR